MKYSNKLLQSNYIGFLDLIICLPFVLVPLFIDLPYRVNIYLTWEGAYRLYTGQIPFADFYLPMGFGFWLIPASFFKIFGPELSTLVKAQIFINFLSLICLRGILYKIKLKPFLISLSLLIFCLTYIIYNFWPWYNHSVVVFELIGLYLLTWYLIDYQKSKSIFLVILSALFMLLAFFTKQDAGAIGLMIGLVLLIYHGYMQKRFKPTIIYMVSFFLAGLITITPFLNYDLLYWFNLGQPPHNSRLEIVALIDVFFSGNAIWEKVYLATILLLFISSKKESLLELISEKHFAILFILASGLICQALITRVTSPLPTDHMTYFHAFAITFIFFSLKKTYSATENWKPALMMAIVITLVFSDGYWNYLKGVMGVNISKEDSSIPRRKEPWTKTEIAGFQNMLLPSETVHGMEKILDMKVTDKQNLKVLNMTELTPLALELNYIPPTNQPLWYHLNVGMFQKEVEIFCERIKNDEYDLVLFQDIPGLIDFFPFQVRDTLKTHYDFRYKFLAPRKKENSFIEVYTRKR